LPALLLALLTACCAGCGPRADPAAEGRLRAAGVLLNPGNTASRPPFVALWAWPPRSAALGLIPAPDTSVLRDLRLLPELKVVSLRDVPLDAAAARALADSPVEQLHLCRCPLGPGAARALASGGPRGKGPPLTDLDFVVTLPPPADLKELGRLPAVICVSLQGVVVPPGGLAPFYADDAGKKSFPALRWFTVNDFDSGGTTLRQYVSADVPPSEGAALVAARPEVTFRNDARARAERDRPRPPGAGPPPGTPK
jgi:hypothetical protein